jgi:hypothetical protein
VIRTTAQVAATESEAGGKGDVHFQLSMCGIWMHGVLMSSFY